LNTSPRKPGNFLLLSAWRCSVLRLFDVVDSLVGLVIPDDPGDLLALTKDLITLRNATEHQLVVCAAMIDQSGIAGNAGSTTAKLLQSNGAAPGAAYRWLRVGSGLSGLDRTAGYSPDGFLSPNMLTQW
jgi:hypothetical protein